MYCLNDKWFYLLYVSNVKPAFSNSNGLKSGFEKLRFRDGLAWMVGLTVVKKLRVQLPSGYCAWTGPHGTILWKCRSYILT